MPRIVKRSPLNRHAADCETCGKHCEKPYVYQVVPSYMSARDIPAYSKKAVKTNRLELTGNRKVRTMNFCDVDCWKERPFEKN